MEIGEGTDRILKSESLIKPDGIKWAFHYIILLLATFEIVPAACQANSHSIIGIDKTWGRRIGRSQNQRVQIAASFRFLTTRIRRNKSLFNSVCHRTEHFTDLLSSPPCPFHVMRSRNEYNVSN